MQILRPLSNRSAARKPIGSHLLFSDKNTYQYERHTEVTQNRRSFILISKYHPFSWEKSLCFSLKVLVEHKHKQSKWSRLQMITSWITTLRGLWRHRVNKLRLDCVRFLCARVLDLRSILIWTPIWSGNLLSSEVISVTYCIVKWWGVQAVKRVHVT